MTEAVTQTGLLETLGLNGKLFIAQLVNFSIVLLVVWRWVYRPLLKAMDARSQKIDQGLKNAAEAKRLMADASEEREKVIRKAKTEARAILETVKAEADTERAKRSAELQAELDKQLTEARTRLAQDKDAIMVTIRSEAADLVAKATERVTGDVIQSKEHRALIEQALKETSRV